MSSTLPHRFGPYGGQYVPELLMPALTELERLAAAGVDAVLIGEALMRSADIEAASRDLTGVGARISS